jgi:hypothetical protein
MAWQFACSFMFSQCILYVALFVFLQVLTVPMQWVWFVFKFQLAELASIKTVQNHCVLTCAHFLPFLFSVSMSIRIQDSAKLPCFNLRCAGRQTQYWQEIWRFGSVETRVVCSHPSRLTQSLTHRVLLCDYVQRTAKQFEHLLCACVCVSNVKLRFQFLLYVSIFGTLHHLFALVERECVMLC